MLMLFHHLFRTDQLINKHNLVFFLFPRVAVPTIATSSRVCVWVFVFLSSYGLSYKYLKTTQNSRTKLQVMSSARFAVRQWFSLLKPFFIFFLLTVLIYALTGRNLAAKYEGHVLWFFLDFFGIADLFHTPLLLGVFWYICFAQVLIICIPFLCTLAKKYHLLLLPLAFLLLQFIPDGIVSKNGGNYLEYLFVAICGCVFAVDDRMNRWSAKKMNLPLKLLLCFITAGIAALAIVFEHKLRGADSWHLRGICSAVAAICICFIFGILLRQKHICAGLAFLGKYAGGVFLVHPILYGLLPKIVYISHSAAVVWLVLMAESYIAVLLIEYVKKLLRYDKLMEGLYQKISSVVPTAQETE